MITKKDLQAEVAFLNEKYCNSTKNQLSIQESYGGYQVVLVGKKSKKTGKPRGLGGAVVPITDGYLSARNTIAELYRKDGKGRVKDEILWQEGKRPKKTSKAKPVTPKTPAKKGKKQGTAPGKK